MRSSAFAAAQIAGEGDFGGRRNVVIHNLLKKGAKVS